MKNLPNEEYLTFSKVVPRPNGKSYACFDVAPSLQPWFSEMVRIPLKDIEARMDAVEAKGQNSDELYKAITASWDADFSKA